MEKTHLEKHHESTFKVVMILFFILFVAGAVYRMTYSADPEFPPKNSGIAMPSKDMIVVGAGWIYHFTNGSWNEISKPGSSLTAVDCTAPDNCRALDSDGIIHHFNGTGWTVEHDFETTNTFYNGEHFTDIDCVDDTCWATAIYNPGNYDARTGRIYTNAGGTWERVTLDEVRALNAISCYDKSRCYAAGKDIVALKGSTLETVHTYNRIMLKDIQCYEKDKCWAGGSLFDIIHVGETSPSSHLFSFFQGHVNTIDCVDGVCMALDGSGVVYTTVNGKWEYVGRLYYVPVRTMTCVSPTECWIISATGKMYLFNGKQATVHDSPDVRGMFDMVVVPAKKEIPQEEIMGGPGTTAPQ